MRSSTHLCLYDWESLKLIRRVEITCRAVYWADAGDTLAVVSDESFFVLKYSASAVAQATDAAITEDGIEDALDVSAECQVCMQITVI